MNGARPPSYWAEQLIKMMKNTWIAAVVALALCGMSACQKKKNEPVSQSDPSEQQLISEQEAKIKELEEKERKLEL